MTITQGRNEGPKPSPATVTQLVNQTHTWAWFCSLAQSPPHGIALYPPAFRILGRGRNVG